MLQIHRFFDDTALFTEYSCGRKNANNRQICGGRFVGDYKINIKRNYVFYGCELRAFGAGFVGWGDGITNTFCSKLAPDSDFQTPPIWLLFWLVIVVF